MTLSSKVNAMKIKIFTVMSQSKAVIRGARWPSGHIYSPKRTGNTHEAVAPSRHDSKIVGMLKVNKTKTKSHNSLWTAILHSIDSVASTSRDFGITPM